MVKYGKYAETRRVFVCRIRLTGKSLGRKLLFQRSAEAVRFRNPDDVRWLVVFFPSVRCVFHTDFGMAYEMWVFPKPPECESGDRSRGNDMM